MGNQTATKKFGLADKISYAFGDFGNDLTFVLSALFLLKFYTDVMGVSAAVVGGMMMLARIVDAFTDVTMGQIVDRSKPTARGKFVPWLRRMCGPVAVASILLYATWFQNMPMGFKIFWMFASYLLWGSVCYTGINIPYGSMASAITDSPKERAQLSNWRTIGSVLGQLVVAGVLPMVVYYKNASGQTVLSGTRLSIAAVACSVLAVACYLICYHMTTERVKVEQKTGKFSIRELLRSLAHNKSLIGIIVSALFLLLAQLSLGNMGSYIYPNYFGNASALTMVTFIGCFLTLGLSTFVVKIADKIGKKEVVIYSSVISAAALFAAYLVHTHDLTVWMGLYIVGYIGIAIFSLVCWAMITDVIDDTEIKTKNRADGTIYSIYSFARKLGQACSAGLTGLLLSIVGYTKETAFDTSVVDGIYNITCLVPIIGYILLILALVFLYPLGKKAVDSNAEKLRALHQNK